MPMALGFADFETSFADFAKIADFETVFFLQILKVGTLLTGPFRASKRSRFAPCAA